MQESKANIRQLIKRKLKEFPETNRIKADQNIFFNVISLPVLLQAQKIALYYSVRSEVDTIELINYLLLQKKEVFLPRIENHNLVFLQITNLSLDMDKHKDYWIFEPKKNLPMIAAEQLDLIIVPMLAFDKNNNRIGYGQGYYDRYLKNIKNEKIIGLAYQLQEVPMINDEVHDQKMFLIITE